MGGRSIVTTIHQPSSRMYQELDKLLLLSEGRAIYYGEAQAAAAWFERVGYKLPYGINVADFLLDLASGDIAQGPSGREYFVEKWQAYLTDCRADAKERVRRAKCGFVADVKGRRALLGGVLGGEGREASVRTSPKDDVESGGESWAEEEAVKGPRVGASWTAQLGYLTQRFMKVRRFDALGVQRFVQLIAVGVLTGLFWWQSAGGTTSLRISDTGGL